MGLSCKCCKKKPILDCNVRWTPDDGREYKIRAAGAPVSMTNPFKGSSWAVYDPDTMEEIGRRYHGIGNSIPVPIDGEPGDPLPLAGIGELWYGYQNYTPIFEGSCYTLDVLGDVPYPMPQRGVGVWGWNPHRSESVV